MVRVEVEKLTPIRTHEEVYASLRRAILRFHVKAKEDHQHQPHPLKSGHSRIKKSGQSRIKGFEAAFHLLIGGEELLLAIFQQLKSTRRISREIVYVAIIGLHAGHYRFKFGNSLAVSHLRFHH